MQAATTTSERYAELQGLSDEEIHRRFKELGDESACDRLYDKYRTRIVSYIRSMWSKRQDVQNDAEDIFQVAFYETIAKPPFSGDGAFPQALFGTARSRSRDYARRQTRLVLDDEAAHIEDAQAISAYTPADGLSLVEASLHEDDPMLSIAVEECMDRLTPLQQQVLQLTVYEHMKELQVATILAKDRGAVSMACYRARMSLRRCLEAKGILRK